MVTRAVGLNFAFVSAALFVGCAPSALVGSWYTQGAAGSATLEVESMGVLRLNEYTRHPTAAYPQCVAQRYRAGSYRDEGGRLVVTIDATMDMDIGCATSTWRLGSPRYTETWTYALSGTTLALTDARGVFVGAFRPREAR